MREAVRYTAKNIKWTAGEVQVTDFVIVDFTYILFIFRFRRLSQTLMQTLCWTMASLPAIQSVFGWRILPKRCGIYSIILCEIWNASIYGFCAHFLPHLQQISFLAAAKIGAKVVDIDTNIGTVGEVRDVLKTIKAKALIFDPVTDQQDNLLLLRKSIPEFFECESTLPYDPKFIFSNYRIRWPLLPQHVDDDSAGQFFHSKHFPTLKYFIHTGFDIEMGGWNIYVANVSRMFWYRFSPECFDKTSFSFTYVAEIIAVAGCLNYKSLFLANPVTSEVDAIEPTLSDSTPVYTKVSKGKCAIHSQNWTTIFILSLSSLQDLPDSFMVARSPMEICSITNLGAMPKIWSRRNFLNCREIMCI